MSSDLNHKDPTFEQRTFIYFLSYNTFWSFHSIIISKETWKHKKYATEGPFPSQLANCEDT
jgi:hypothetical protein